MSTVSPRLAEAIGSSSLHGSRITRSSRRWLHELLGDEDFLASLRAMVRRRVPRQEAEDVLQAVVCDALASECAPHDPAEAPRWVMGIARHKVADFHRLAARNGSIGAVEARAPLEPVEERDLLTRLAAAEQGTSRETLRWVVREWSGDPLHTIAEEVSLPAEVVRQRVSRLRRKLRAKWLVALFGAGLLFAGGSALWNTDRRSPTARALDARSVKHLQRLREMGTAPRSESGSLDGTWRIAEVIEAETIKPEVLAWARAQAALATITMHGSDVTITTPAGDRLRTLRFIEQRGNRWIGELVDSEGRATPVEIRANGQEATVIVTGGSLRGSLRLVR